MTALSRTVAQLGLVLSIALCSTAKAPSSASRPAKSADDEVSLRALAAIHPIDVHVLVFKTDPAFQKMLERLNLKLMNILVVDDTNPHRKDLQRRSEERRVGKE